MKTLSLAQGSLEWQAHRAGHFNASDAPAMLGVSPYKTRSLLLQELHTGITADVDAAKQRIFDDGHRFEALARPLAEYIIGEDLYPVVGTEGRFSASFDGITMDGVFLFEHKSLNEDLGSAIRQQGGNANEFLAPMYRVQMEHQLMVSGAQRVLFMASKWDGEKLIEERHCWYTPDLELRAQIVAGWAQFEADLAAYVQPAAEPPAPVGQAPETLPALRIEITGAVTASNLAEFKETALAAIRSVNRELSTDKDFADAEKAVKWCEEVESRLDAAKEHALSQTATIDTLFKALDDIKAESRAVRLDISKLVTKRKEERKGEIVASAIGALENHVRELNDSIGRPLMPKIGADFAGAIKGKRSFALMQDAVDTELARAKIEANATHQRITANLRVIEAKPEQAFLFPDVATLVLKAPDDLSAVIAARVAEHDRKEATRLEAARERIRAEEQVKAQREAAAAEKERQQQEAARLVAAPMPAVVPAPPPIAPVSRPTLARAAKPATLNLGAICSRLGFTVTAAFVGQLGIQPASTDKRATLYTEAQFEQLCAALITHIGSLQHKAGA